MKTRVYIVDDSATVRLHLRTIIADARDFEVVGEAGSADDGIAQLWRARPDLVLLDVFMPGRSAAALVRTVLAIGPMPILLVSSAPKDTDAVFEALSAGALEVVSKPRHDQADSARLLLEAMRRTRGVKVTRRSPSSVRGDQRAVEVVVIGSSTGGPAALRDFLGELPAEFRVPVVVAQHMAESFDAGLVTWLRNTTGFDVRLAANGDALEPGVAHVAPAGHDVAFIDLTTLKVRRAKRSGFHPSVDLLIESAAAMFGSRALAVVLSGIGSDGTQGAKALKRAGGTIWVQDRASSVTHGMPGSVAAAGLSALSAPPRQLAHAVLRRVGIRD